MNKKFLLAIDVGNTNTVFAVLKEEEIICSWRTSTKVSRTGDEYYAWISNMLKRDTIAKEDIFDIIISTVVPDIIFELKTFCLKFFGIEAKLIGEGNANINVKTDLLNKDEIGTDRLLNSIAVWNKYKGANIVVDFGTATTFDVVSKKGVYLGGVIAPGIDLSISALYKAAAKLPKIAITTPKGVVGKNTESAMHSGIYWGYTGLIEGIVTRILNEQNEKMRVIATGGLAPLFASATNIIDIVDENLTLYGLYVAHKKIMEDNS